MPPLLMNFLMFAGPQVASGYTGQMLTRRAIQNDDLRIQMPGIQSRGAWTDVRMIGGGALSAVGAAMSASRNNIVRFAGILALSFGGVMLGSLGATELVRAKAIELKGGVKPAGAPARISGDSGYLLGDDFIGADGCGPGLELEAVQVSADDWIVG